MDIKKLKQDAKAAIKGNVGNVVIANILIFFCVLAFALIVGLLLSFVIASFALMFSEAVGTFILSIFFFAFSYLCAYFYIGIYLGFYNFMINLIQGKIAKTGTVFNYMNDTTRKRKVFKVFFRYSIIPALIGFILFLGIDNGASVSNIPVQLATTFSPFELIISLTPNSITNIMSIVPPILIGVIVLFIGIFIHLPFFLALRKKDIENEILLNLTKEIGNKYRNDFIKLSFSFLIWTLAINIPALILNTPSIVNNPANYSWLYLVGIASIIMVFVSIYFYCYINMTYVMFYDRILTDYFGEEYIPEFGINPETLMQNQTVKSEEIDKYRRLSHDRMENTTGFSKITDTSADKHRKEEAKRKADAEMTVSIKDTRRKI